jgi:ubiquinone/menaquinone biosynthesis C-methylase UbiE
MLRYMAQSRRKWAATWSTYVNPRGGDINIRSGPQMREYEQIADRIAAERLGPVLDWGCGWGQITDLLRKRNVDVVSYEYRENEPHRTIRLERFPEITAHVWGEPVKLPFPDDHFAAVLSCGVLEHVQDPGASLAELHRVLAPGGRLFVYKLPNRFSYLEVIARALGLYYHGKLQYDRVYDRRRVFELIPSHGFRIDAFRRTNMLPLTLSNDLAWRYTDQITRLNELIGRVPIANLIATNVEVDATALPQAAVIDLRERVAAAQHEHAYREPQHAGYERELHRDIA